MRSLLFILSVFFLSSFEPKKEETIVLIVSPTTHVRIQYGVEKLTKSLISAGYQTTISRGNSIPNANAIVITEINDPLFELVAKQQGINKPAIKEGFSIN